ncbi:alpha/beta hydrolase family esterase [Actinocorallia longicatena]|uniref:PHB depolymerase family esterase n=1 Tax=Actinocorallia longicatena TaxID=111803 RepID=A0ABP6QP62_9ACTN
MRRLALFVTVCCLALAGCQGTDEPERKPGKTAKPPVATGTHRYKLDVGTPGHREYLLRVPAGLKGPAPLVVALHGGASNAERFEKESGFDGVSDDEKIVVAYPDGFMLSWNAGGCCGPAKVGKVDDVGFVNKMIDKLVGQGVADPKKIFVTGFSNGGGLAYKMACDGPGKVRAIGVVSAALIMDCAPSRPVSTMIVHGTADRSVPYKGGGQRDFNDKRPFPPFSKAVDFWLKEDELGALEQDGKCRQSEGSVTVRVCTRAGGTHEWPEGMARDLWNFFSTT